MNLVWLDDFLALAASGNFSRAAQARHTSQPAFSRRIRGLEEWLGTDLFDRSGQPARLTAAGVWFLPVAQEMLARVGRLPAEARAVAEANGTTLRLAATHALSFTFVPRWLQQLEPVTSGGAIQLVSDAWARCEALLASRQVQFVVAHARAGAGAGDIPFVAVGQDALLSVRAPVAPEGVLLQFSEESGLGRILRQELGDELGALQPVFTASLASVLKSMALDGKGLAWLPESLVRQELAAGTLHEVKQGAGRIPLEVRLYRDPAALGAHAERFWEAAARLAAAGGTP